MRIRLLSLLLLIVNLSCSNSNTQYKVPHWKLPFQCQALCIDGDRIYFGDYDNKFYCVNINTKKTEWVFTANGICNTPVINQNKIFFTDTNLWLYVLDINGKQIRKHKLTSTVKSVPIVYSNTLIITITDVGLIAFDIETGNQIWEVVQKPTNLSTSELVVYNNQIFVGNLNKTFSMIDAKNGKYILKREYNNVIQSASTVKDSISVFGGFNFTNNDQSFINGINIKNGEKIWERKLEYNARYKPVIHNDKVYFGVENSGFMCLNLFTGEMVWEIKLEEGTLASEILYDKDKIYFGSVNRYIYILDARNGKVIKKEQVEYGIHNPIIYKNFIVFVTADGSIFQVSR